MARPGIDHEVRGRVVARPGGVKHSPDDVPTANPNPNLKTLTVTVTLTSRLGLLSKVESSPNHNPHSEVKACWAVPRTVLPNN